VIYLSKGTDILSNKESCLKRKKI